jgi:hypothetical protein
MIYKPRRDIFENWNTVNPIIKEGQVIWITDKQQYLIGDGVSSFKELWEFYVRGVRELINSEA